MKETLWLFRHITSPATPTRVGRTCTNKLHKSKETYQRDVLNCKRDLQTVQTFQDPNKDVFVQANCTNQKRPTKETYWIAKETYIHQKRPAQHCSDISRGMQPQTRVGRICKQDLYIYQKRFISRNLQKKPHDFSDIKRGMQLEQLDVLVGKTCIHQKRPTNKT